jgi:hypothetical protein
VPSLAFIALFVAIGLLVLIPTRRLFLAGWTPPALTAYYLTVVALGLFVAELRGPARYLIPILVLAYIVPFITARNGIGRLRDRLGGPPSAPRGRPGPGGPARPEDDRSRSQRPPPRNVTPKEAPPPDART